jgi:hypothetical protein
LLSDKRPVFLLYSEREQIPRYLKAIQKAGRGVTHVNGRMKILVIRSGYNSPTLFRDLQESDNLPSRILVHCHEFRIIT